MYFSWRQNCTRVRVSAWGHERFCVHLPQCDLTVSICSPRCLGFALSLEWFDCLQGTCHCRPVEVAVGGTRRNGESKWPAEAFAENFSTDWPVPNRSSNWIRINQSLRWKLNCVPKGNDRIERENTAIAKWAKIRVRTSAKWTELFCNTKMVNEIWTNEVITSGVHSMRASSWAHTNWDHRIADYNRQRWKKKSPREKKRKFLDKQR